MDLLDRFRGCLYGVAVGDALGMPTEGYTASEIQTKFGVVRDMMPAPPDHFHNGLLAGQFTDDTQETLMLAESLIESSGLSVTNFVNKLVAWGRSWTIDECSCKGVGFATRSSVESMIAGIPWNESGLSIPTCGSAIRSAPIGLLFNGDLGLVSRYAELQSLPTHCGNASRAGAIAVATGVALCLKGFEKEVVLRIAASSARRLDADFAERLLWVLSLKDLKPKEALSRIKNSPLARETVPAAFYCFIKFDPEEALIHIASNGGDTDSIASIAGSLFGAAFGMSWIPDRWLAPLAEKERIESASLGLLSLYNLLVI